LYFILHKYGYRHVAILFIRSISNNNKQLHSLKSDYLKISYIASCQSKALVFKYLASVNTRCMFARESLIFELQHHLHYSGYMSLCVCVCVCVRVCVCLVCVCVCVRVTWSSDSHDIRKAGQGSTPSHIRYAVCSISQ
jgi:hypothetical protein